VSAGRTIATKKAPRRSAGPSCLCGALCSGDHPRTKRPSLAQVRAAGERCRPRRVAADVAKLPALRRAAGVPRRDFGRSGITSYSIRTITFTRPLRAPGTMQKATPLSPVTGRDGGGPLPVENLAGRAVHQRAPLSQQKVFQDELPFTGSERSAAANAASYFVIDGLRPRFGFDHLVERTAPWALEERKRARINHDCIRSPDLLGTSPVRADGGLTLGDALHWRRNFTSENYAYRKQSARPRQSRRNRRVSHDREPRSIVRISHTANSSRAFGSRWSRFITLLAYR
jgi:hypothetical protein